MKKNMKKINLTAKELEEKFNKGEDIIDYFEVVENDGLPKTVMKKTKKEILDYALAFLLMNLDDYIEEDIGMSEEQLRHFKEKWTETDLKQTLTGLVVTLEREQISNTFLKDAYAILDLLGD